MFHKGRHKTQYAPIYTKNLLNLVFVRTMNKLLNLISTYVGKRHKRSTSYTWNTTSTLEKPQNRGKYMQNRGKIYNFKNPAISNYRFRELIK